EGPRAESDASTPAEDDGASADAISPTLYMEQNRILDTCGEPFVARGMEQIVGTQFSADGTLAGLAEELVKTGSNAVRLLPQDLGPSEIDELLTLFEEEK